MNTEPKTVVHEADKELISEADSIVTRILTDNAKEDIYNAYHRYKTEASTDYIVSFQAFKSIFVNKKKSV